MSNRQSDSNSKYRDSSSKIIFEDPTLCAQFLRGYLNIPILKDVQPEDIEDVTSRYVHLFTEERNSDAVKRVHIMPQGNASENKMQFYLISLIEYKSNVDYNVVMQIFRYMIFICPLCSITESRIGRRLSGFMSECYLAMVSWLK